MKLIGVAGQMGVGKDTVGEMIRHISPQYEIKKFAGKLKEIAGMFLGVPVEHFENRKFKMSKLGGEWGHMSVREFLQRLGTEAIRNGLHEDAWVNALFADYTPESHWVITDCRFRNEFEIIRKMGGVLIKVERYVETVSDHPSECFVEVYDEYDYIIDNSGTLEELAVIVENILTQQTGRSAGI